MAMLVNRSCNDVGQYSKAIYLDNYMPGCAMRFDVYVFTYTGLYDAAQSKYSEFLIESVSWC